MDKDIKIEDTKDIPMITESVDPIVSEVPTTSNTQQSSIDVQKPKYGKKSAKSMKFSAYEEEQGVDEADVALLQKYLAGEVDFNEYELHLENECPTNVEHEEEVTTENVPAKKIRKKRNESKIPTHLKGLMGEANLRYSRGDHETAQKMCYEVIRQCPAAYEPYLTLAQLFEKKDPEKSLQYNMLAAFLRPKDVDMWEYVAKLAMARNNIKLAITCYSNAIRAQPRNVNLHIRRIELIESLGDSKFVLRSYVRVLPFMDEEHSEALLDISMKVARQFHSQKEYTKAFEALDIPFKKCPRLITPEMVNVMLELLLLNKNYSYCLDIFLEHCNIETEIFLGEDNKIEILSYKMPNNLAIDLQIKFIILAIKLEAFHLIDKLLEPLLSEDNVEMIGDLYLDVAEALMVAERYHDALKLLVPLIKSNNYSLAAVWLKYANCLFYCGLYEQAIESFYTVKQLAPQHTGVRRPLADALLTLGRNDEAIKVLKQDLKTEHIDIAVLVKRIKLLKTFEYYHEYFKALELLLSRHCIVLKHIEEIRAVMFWERPNEKLARIQKLRQFRRRTVEELPIFITDEEPSVEEEYQMLQEALSICYKTQRYGMMQKLIFMSMTSAKFVNKFDELLYLGFFACFLNKDEQRAYPLIRDILLRHIDNCLAWNLFNLWLHYSDTLLYGKFMMRFLSRFTRNAGLRVLEANYALIVGSYRIASAYYTQFLQQRPTPFNTFLLGATLIQVYCQKFTEKREKLVQTIISLFTNYAHMRSQDAFEEIHYNVGRMYHQVGLPHIAVQHYRKVLEYNSSLAEKYPDLSLKREAAYNLHLIYKHSGNIREAHNVLLKYVKF